MKIILVFNVIEIKYKMVKNISDHTTFILNGTHEVHSVPIN